MLSGLAPPPGLAMLSGLAPDSGPRSQIKREPGADDLPGLEPVAEFETVVDFGPVVDLEPAVGAGLMAELRLPFLVLYDGLGEDTPQWRSPCDTRSTPGEAPDASPGRSPAAGGGPGCAHGTGRALGRGCENAWQKL
jgi:hypothetical protein